MTLPRLPIDELFKHGLVAPAMIFVGLLFIVIGAVGDLSFANRKLLLGACLICFGIAWHSAGRMTLSAPLTVGDETISPREWRWNYVFTFVFFLLLFLFSVFVFVTGHLPPS
jgi:hypothetical protein